MQSMLRQCLTPDPPEDLRSGPVRLVFEEVVRPCGHDELVPFYHFAICDDADSNVGHINFRVGDTPHVTQFAGHVGYRIEAQHRGHSHSLHACLALAPFIRTRYAEVIVTSDPGNAASLRIIEKLGAVFLGEVDVPESDPAHASGARRRRRFRWSP